MKKIFLCFIVVLFSNAIFAQQNTKTKYFFVTGREYANPGFKKDLVKAQPVYSNIFSTRCKEDYLPLSLGLANEFSDYYAAYLAKSRGYDFLRQLYTFGPYETHEEAEKERRKQIAKDNNYYEPILVKDFSGSCD